MIDPRSPVVVSARDLKKKKRGSGEGYGWKDFNFPSGKMTIADARGGYEYIASPPAPSNSTIQA